MDLHFFDRQSNYTVIERKLPHWVQPGVVCFITWRTNDSIPAAVLEQWRNERRMWLRQHQINRRLGIRGRFWQQDGFDHLVRSAEQFEHFRRYIARNGIKAKLSPSDYLHYSKSI